MLIVRPQLHRLITAAESRTLKQLEALGVPLGHAETARQTSVALFVPPSPSPARLLLARACLDYLLRLDPLVSEVHLTGLTQADLSAWQGIGLFADYTTDDSEWRTWQELWPRN